MRRIKVKEIAHNMGISQATVSLALNNRAGVSEQTKQRIFEYMKTAKTELEPFSADAFVKLILFTATEHLKDYEEWNLFNLSYVEISRLLQQKHIELRLVSVSNKEELNEALVNGEGEGAIGVLLEANELPASLYPTLKNCVAPLVLYDCEMGGEGWDVVNFHNAKAVFDGMQRLKDNGHQDIVYLRHSAAIHNFVIRRKSYLQYFSEGHMEGHRPEILDVGSTPDMICDFLSGYLQRRETLPDALFLENFTVSIGTLMALKKLNISVPETISLIGIDDLPATALHTMDLSRFSMPHRERSSLVVRQLLYRIEKNNQNTATEILLTPVFHVGETVRAKV